MKKITRSFIIFITTTMLCACTTPALFKNTKNNIEDMGNQIEDSHQKENASLLPASAVVVKDELYVDPAPINLNTQPSWLDKPISLHGEKLPFSFYANNIVRSANITKIGRAHV